MSTDFHFPLLGALRTYLNQVHSFSITSLFCILMELDPLEIRILLIAHLYLFEMRERSKTKRRKGECVCKNKD